MATDPLFLTPCDSWEIYHYWCFFKCLPFFCFSIFFLFFSFSIFISLFRNLPFWSLSCSIHIKTYMCVFQSLFFFHLLHLSPFILFSSLFAFICSNIFFNLILFSLSPYSFGFFFEKLSSLTFFAHIFLSSLSFFLSIVFLFFFFFLFSLFFFSPSLFSPISCFSCLLSPSFFEKNMFHSLSLSWCRGLFPPWKRKKLTQRALWRTRLHV